MASLSATDIAAILKEIYPDGLPKSVMYKNSPFLAALPKDTEAAYSKQIQVPVRWGNPQGASADFGTARNSGNFAQASSYSAFSVTTKNYYGSAAIDGEAIDKSKRDRGSFVRALEKEISGAQYTMKRALTAYVFGNGGAALGRVATSGITTTVLTLANPSDVVWFEKGALIGLSSADGTSGSLRGSPSYATLSAVDRSAGTLTATANWTATIAGATDGDYLFKKGDFGAAISGYEAWVPRSAPGATAFFGVDRTPDTRLSGVRKDVSDRPIEEGLLDAAELLAREGSAVDFAVMHTTAFANLQKALGSKVIYDTMEAFDDARIGFKVISFMGPAGPIKVMADPNAPVGRLLMGQLDTWTLYTMGDMVRMLDNDGLPYLRQVTADGIEIQLVFRGQLACDAPGYNGNFAI